MAKKRKTKSNRKPTPSRDRKRRLRQKQSSSLNFEALEPKQLLAAVTVGNGTDVVDATSANLTSIAALIANPGIDGTISLREAITAANNTSGADTITFDHSLTTDGSATINLVSQLPQVTDALTINGPGANLLTIDAGNGADNAFNTNDGFRILHINDGTSAQIPVQLSGLTLTGGDLPGTSQGGAVFSEENLTITESVISGNAANRGGGILAGNTINIVDSTVSGNAASQFGGGLLNVAGNATITGSTISGNTGIGIQVTAGGILDVRNSTIAENDIAIRLNGSGTRGTINHSIVTDFIEGQVGGDYNLFSDALLGPLQNNGGPTPTHALQLGSPAINAGDPNFDVNGPDGLPNTADDIRFDQRGSGFDRVTNGRIDIGAFEYQDLLKLHVSTTNDVILDDGLTSLREAIDFANSQPGLDTITFDSSLGAGGVATINLVSQLPQVTDALTINGPGAILLTIDAGNGADNVFNTNDGFRILHIDDGTPNQIPVHLNGLTLTGGDLSFGANGGAIDSEENLTITASVISGNAASRGGGVFAGNTINIVDSTISGNAASQFGGGLLNVAGNANITGSTISGNTGNGIQVTAGGILDVRNSTITENDVAIRINGSGSRGTVNHSIVTDFIEGQVGGNYNVFSDPLLGPLQNNGGPTPTHALLPGSPAINAGDPNFDLNGPDGLPNTADDIRFDQRGSGFERIAIGRIDIGAFEFQERNSLRVTTTTDVVDDEGATSLREAILFANSQPGADTITFDPSLTSGGAATINLTTQLPTITDALSISGPGANLLTVSAGGGTDGTIGNGDGFRILNIDDGVNANQIEVSLRGLTLTGGDTASSMGDNGAGGAIRNFENLSITDSSVSGNASAEAGGGIISDHGGTLTINDSTIAGNRSANDGGGVFSSTGAVTVTNSTISGNNSGDDGGGIFTSSGKVMLTSSTVTENNASDGGGVYLQNNSQSLALQNSLVAGNTAAGTEPDLYFFSGNPTDFDFSLIGDIGTSPFPESQTADSNGNLVGNAAGGGVIDPMLSALADHVRPTQTHLPLPGSPAIDAGNTGLLPADVNDLDGDLNTTEAIPFDQRGLTRIVGSSVDIGAVERQLNERPVFTSPATVDVAENRQAVHALTVIDTDIPAQTVTYRLLGQVPAGDLGSDQSLEVDQTISSPDGTAVLLMQGDGNLVLRDSGVVIWATGTDNQGAVRATIQADGNLVLTDAAGATVYQTNSGSAASSLARLHVTDDGQLIVLRVDGARLWESTSNNGSGVGTVLTPAPLAPAFARAADTDLFQVAGSNQLEFVATPDFENPADANGDNLYEVSVLADDGNGGTTPQEIRVTVTDADEGLLVTTIDDAVVADGMISLQEAITFANFIPGADTITFDAALAGSTISLGSELLLTSDITIDGDTNGDEKADVTISGNSTSRIIRITGVGTDVDLLSLTLTDGRNVGATDSFGGGAILAEFNTSLDVVNSTIRNSAAIGTSDLGGGISSLGTLHIVNSTLTENSASPQRGGSLFVNGTATLTNTTVDGNSAGGGVRVNTGSTLKLNNSTITNNTGDGVSFASGTSALTSNNSVIALNSGLSIREGTLGGQVTAGNSFFGSVVTIDTDLGGNLGVTTSGDDPMLAALTDNGAPVQTRAIQEGSPLIDAGDDSALPTETALGIDVDSDGSIESTAISVDARGTGFGRVRGSRVDIGAFEIQNQAPVFMSPTTANVAENNQAVHTLTATDADIPSQTITYRLLGQAPAGDLGPGQSLLAGQSITSPDGTAMLLMQGDGNLVVYQSGSAVWASGTDGSGAVRATIQDDGNLVLADAGGNTIYQTNSGADANSLARLHVTNEGQVVVIRVDGARLWESTGFSFGTVLTPGTLSPEFTKAADTDLFQITAGDQLGFSAAPDFELPADANSNNVYEVTVLADDGNGGLAPQTILVTVTPVNDNSPVFTSPTSANVAENTQTVHTLTATDDDLSAQTITFSISGSGADNGRFELVNGNELQFIAAPDFESPTDANGDNVYEVSVQADDGNGSVTPQTILVTVTDINEATIFTSPPMANVAENTQTVHTLTASDEDLPAQTITFSIFGAGADNDKFEVVSGNQLQFIAAPDFENPTDANGDNVYEVTVQADDGNGGLTPQTILVTVTDLDDSLVVTTTADSVVTDGMTSLREAILFANSQPGADSITFDPSVFTGGAASLIRLGGTQLIVSESLTIDGSTGTGIVITADANNDDATLPGTDITDVANNTNTSDNSRVLEFTPGTGDLTLRGLTLTGGSTVDGGAVVFRSSDTLWLEQSSLSGNNGGGGNGGAIWAQNGDVTGVDSTVSGNRTGGNGGGIWTTNGNLTLNGSTISGNSVNGAYSDGGAIWSAYGAVTLTGSTVSGNSATSTFSDGGAIWSDSSNVTLTNSVVSGNSAADDGGGIRNSSGSITLIGSTVSGNSAGDEGGGVRTTSGAITLTGSTVSGNSAVSEGGGIWTRRGVLTLTSGTVVGNSSATGGGIFVRDTSGNPALTIHNSIIAGNTASVSGTDVQTDPESVLTINHSLIGDTTSGFSAAQLSSIASGKGNLQNVDPMLEPLADNGGPTQTHALLLGSPAIDAGDPSIVFNANEFDQRGTGFARLDGAFADMGAYELAVTPQVDSVVINGGDTQRSMVSEITVTFNEVVNKVDANSFILMNTTTNTQVVPTVATSVINGRTVATLTFSGAGIIGGSLADGDYTLTTLDTITDRNGNQLDGDNDGQAGGNAIDEFFRFFGDINGDRRVNIADFFQFRSAFGNPDNYNAAFDYNGDGVINIIDFFQFRSRFGSSL